MGWVAPSCRDAMIPRLRPQLGLVMLCLRNVSANNLRCCRHERSGKLRSSFAFALAVALFSSPITAAECKLPRLKQGMNYEAARKTIIAFGFQAPLGPAYGYQESDEKVRTDCFGSVAICNRFPEMESCSGFGHCRLVFTDAHGNMLYIFTYGEVQKPRENMVSGFEIECKKR